MAFQRLRYSLPRARHAHASCVFSGKNLILCGGGGGGGAPMNSVRTTNHPVRQSCYNKTDRLSDEGDSINRMMYRCSFDSSLLYRMRTL